MSTAALYDAASPLERTSNELPDPYNEHVFHELESRAQSIPAPHHGLQGRRGHLQHGVPVERTAGGTGRGCTDGLRESEEKLGSASSKTPRKRKKDRYSGRVIAPCKPSDAGAITTALPARPVQCLFRGPSPTKTAPYGRHPPLSIGSFGCIANGYTWMEWSAPRMIRMSSSSGENAEQARCIYRPALKTEGPCLSRSYLVPKAAERTVRLTWKA
ncbi:Hypothetical predicted protein [Lecanosticta acicola]|uniref:Uncharacterized protein n=1 Tax=Lecanosticta acicola TaxID=111012 RepID=A0AAI9EFT3_9PEZI|nr:Hypothetical predicted protein [Lecanosticta acicola]